MAITTAICTSFKKELLEGYTQLWIIGRHLQSRLVHQQRESRRQHNGVQHEQRGERDRLQRRRRSH